MATRCPKSILIRHDDYDARFVGHTRDGRQFFLTTPFVPYGHDFIALYTFDNAGKLIEAVIDDLGPRDGLDPEHARRLQAQRLTQLGEKTFGDICIQPFAVRRFNITFGLIPRPPEEPGHSWWLIFQPGNCMAFAEPWNGYYDT